MPHRRPGAHTQPTVHPSFFSLHMQSDTCRVSATFDSRGDTLGLDPDTHPFLDACKPTCDSSECTRGFPSGYHPALEHRRQGIDDVSPGIQSDTVLGSLYMVQGCVQRFCLHYSAHLHNPGSRNILVLVTSLNLFEQI